MTDNWDEIKKLQLEREAMIKKHDEEEHTLSDKIRTMMLDE